MCDIHRDDRVSLRSTGGHKTGSRKAIERSKSWLSENSRAMGALPTCQETSWTGQKLWNHNSQLKKWSFLLSQLWIHVKNTKSNFSQHVQTFHSFNKNSRQSSPVSPRSFFLATASPGRISKARIGTLRREGWHGSGFSGFPHASHTSKQREGGLIAAVLPHCVIRASSLPQPGISGHEQGSLRWS